MTSDPVLAVATRAARSAAAVIVDAGRDLKRLPAHSRDQSEIVASAESEAENAIVATLRAAFPDHAILGEESGHIPGAREGGGYKWIIDPIDGAANFVRGYPYYAVAIALVHGADVTHAVVLDPHHDELYTGIRGRGAELNGATIRVSTCLRLADAVVATVIPPRGNPYLTRYLPLLHAVVTQCAGVRRAGSGSLDLAFVAAGRVDGFFVTGLRRWDAAAGGLIAKEAGARVGDFAGGVDYLRTNDVIAAAPGLFNPLREVLAAASGTASRE